MAVGTPETADAFLELLPIAEVGCRGVQWVDRSSRGCTHALRLPREGMVRKTLLPPKNLIYLAVVSFCESVELQKETAERDRERANPECRRRPRTYQLSIGAQATREWETLVAD